MDARQARNIQLLYYLNDQGWGALLKPAKEAIDAVNADNPLQMIEKVRPLLGNFTFNGISDRAPAGYVIAWLGLEPFLERPQEVTYKLTKFRKRPGEVRYRIYVNGLTMVSGFKTSAEAAEARVLAEYPTARRLKHYEKGYRE